MKDEMKSFFLYGGRSVGIGRDLVCEPIRRYENFARKCWLTPACAALAYAAYQGWEKKPVPSRAQSAEKSAARAAMNRHPCVLHDWAQDGKIVYGIDDSRVKK